MKKKMKNVWHFQWNELLKAKKNKTKCLWNVQMCLIEILCSGTLLAPISVNSIDSIELNTLDAKCMLGNISSGSIIVSLFYDRQPQEHMCHWSTTIVVTIFSALCLIPFIVQNLKHKIHKKSILNTFIFAFFAAYAQIQQKRETSFT